MAFYASLWALLSIAFPHVFHSTHFVRVQSNQVYFVHFRLFLLSSILTVDRAKLYCHLDRQQVHRAVYSHIAWYYGLLLQKWACPLVGFNIVSLSFFHINQQYLKFVLLLKNQCLVTTLDNIFQTGARLLPFYVTACIKLIIFTNNENTIQRTPNFFQFI